ncbi:MAG TPA: hypothetical protein VIK61_12985 [Acidimicrobiia bacterium]
MMTTPSDPKRPSDATREFESEDAHTEAGADRAPTSDEEKSAETNELDPKVAEHYEEMAERGANQQGEGRLP